MLLTSPTATATATANAATVDGADAGGWGADETGRALVGVGTGVGTLYVPPVAMPVPGGVHPVVLVRESHQLPAITEDTPTSVDYPIVRGAVGIPHVWVDGVDRTFDLDGDLLDLDNLVSELGHGDRSATGSVNRAQVFNRIGHGSFSWLRPAAKCEVGVVNAGERFVWWAGDLMSHNPVSTSNESGGSYEVSITLQGPLVQAMQANMQPLDRMDPTDIGVVIPRVLNSVLSRRYPRIPTFYTGIPTQKRGSYGQKVGDYVRTLLATAWDGDRQLGLFRDEVDPRQYRLRWNDTTSSHWTLTAAAHGVTADLEEDWTQVTNVLFGRGSLANGHHWMNRKYPYLLAYKPPTYFSNNTSDELIVGVTDADTINKGVTLYQRRLREIGYRVTVDGVFSIEDREATKRLQRDRGLTVDGRVGGQTWSSVWSIGAKGADLRSVRRPLAWDPRVEPFLYHPNGAVAGPNPAFIEGWPRLEDDMDYGDNTHPSVATLDAQQRVARLKDPAIVGTITLETDPWEGSRYHVRPGENVTLKGWEGRDVFLHVASVRINRKAGTVVLTVDSAFRDALTIAQIRDRDTESRPDPARRPGAIGRTRSTSAPDVVTPFDGESPAGILPELTVRGGKWTVWPMALSQVGTLARVHAWTYDPVSEFSIHLFGREVLPSQLRANLGNVLARSHPWEEDKVAEFLDKMGYIEGWGHQGEACGYHPKSKQRGGTVTGQFWAAAPVTYYSQRPPFVWVAILSSVDCRIQAEFDPQPLDS